MPEGWSVGTSTSRLFRAIATQFGAPPGTVKVSSVVTTLVTRFTA